MKIKFLISLLTSILFALLVSAGVAVASGLPFVPIAGALMGMSFIPKAGGVLNIGVYKEVWTGEVVKGLTNTETASFLDGIPDYSRYVSAVGDEAQAIHLAYMGVEPDVLINNITYPIPLQELDGEDIVIQLDKFQTKVTPVTDDELFALSFDKIKEVKDAHAKAIARAKFKKSIHAIAPNANDLSMPVIATSGEDDGTGRKRLTWADIVQLKAKWDALEYPTEGRRLVLCTEHENDLLLLDPKFKDQFYNSTSGKPYNMLGFELYSYAGNPYYNATTLLKLAFTSTPTTDHQRASVAFLTGRMAKASGWTKMYYSEAKTDPDFQRNKVNFRHYFIVLPKVEDGRGAIVSGNI